MKSLTSITKSAKLNGQLLLKESRDPFVQSAFVSLNTKKWVATDAVAKRRQDLILKKSWITTNLIKQVLAQYLFLRSQLKTLMLTKNSPSSVQEEAEEKKTLARAIQLKLQGQWTK